jgi:hypothetical protein
LRSPRKQRLLSDQTKTRRIKSSRFCFYKLSAGQQDFCLPRTRAKF